MTTDPQGPRRRRGLPGIPLLGRGGLVLGVAILLAIVVLGGNVLGGDDSRVNAIADPLSELPSFPVGTIPADAPRRAGGPEFGEWVIQRAYDDWEAAFREAGRPWQDGVPEDVQIRIDSPSLDSDADTILKIGLAVAEQPVDLLGVPGRIELARRENPDSRADLERKRDQMLACLAGAWARTLVTPARLAAVAPAPKAQSVRLGAEIGDPGVCDTFSTDGG